MSAGRYDLTIEQGATEVRTITVQGWDLTGYTVRMQVRPDPTSSTVILTASNGADAQIVLTTPASGVFTLTLAATATTALPPGTYAYDLELASPASPSVVTRLLYGKFVVVPEVTR